MKQQITTELLQTICERANQYAIIKYGREPDRIELYADGMITARFIDYRCGEEDEGTKDISAENLTEDLDAVAKEQKEKEEQERIKRDAYNKEQEKIRREREKQKRKAEYLKLKKEFE
jgi:hypothetical protein